MDVQVNLSTRFIQSNYSLKFILIKIKKGWRHISPTLLICYLCNYIKSGVTGAGTTFLTGVRLFK